MNDLLFVRFLFYGVTDSQYQAFGKGEPRLRQNFKSVHYRPTHVETFKTRYIYFIIHAILPVLLYNRRRWTQLAYPILSYSLYVLSVVLAGHLGWWAD